MLIEVHMLKNYAPSNLNRDETGSPKDCLFGQVPRGRISSQCLKRNLRLSPILRSEMDESLFGVRTKKLPELITEELKARGIPEEYIPIAMQKISEFGQNIKEKDSDDNTTKKNSTKKENQTSQIMFFSAADIDAVISSVIEAIKEAGSVKEFTKLKAKDFQNKLKGNLDRPITLDMALFGRMITSEAFKDVEASMQMAHAVSTNRLEREFDYFTAMDDLLSPEEKGAAMIESTEFNSNCYYHYFNIDVDQFAKNLEGVPDVKEVVNKTVPALVKAFALVNPSGKQNSFAAHALPNLIYVEVKKDKIPISYVNAFVTPVSPSRKHNLVQESVSRLAEEINKVGNKFGLEVQKRFWFTTEDEIKPPENTKVSNTLNDLINELDRVLKEAE